MLFVFRDEIWWNHLKNMDQSFSHRDSQLKQREKLFFNLNNKARCFLVIRFNWQQPVVSLTLNHIFKIYFLRPRDWTRNISWWIFLLFFLDSFICCTVFVAGVGGCSREQGEPVKMSRQISSVLSLTYHFNVSFQTFSVLLIMSLMKSLFLSAFFLIR